MKDYKFDTKNYIKLPEIKKPNNIYYNHGDKPIFISHSIKQDPLGYAGVMEQKILIMPGDGIDVSVLGLKQEKPGNQ